MTYGAAIDDQYGGDRDVSNASREIFEKSIA
jgi:hypothetical protein